MKTKSLILIVLLLISTSTLSYAGDNLYHFMQAHQDYLVIGKVTGLEDKNLYKIRVSELITESSIRRDIPKNIEVKIELSLDIKKGDGIAISLNKRGGGYEVANGVYKVSTSSTNTLEVVDANNIYPDNELAAVELFLKSRGKIKDFYFVEDKTYLHKDSGVVTDEDVCIYTAENGKMLPTEYEKNEKYVIKSEKNVKLIIYAIIIFVVAQVIALLIYLKLNPNCKLMEILKFKEK